MLREIGRQLDRNVFPRVTDGGFVLPSGSGQRSSTVGVEKNCGTSEPRRSEARQGAGPAGGQGSAGGPWSPNQAPPLVISGVTDRYQQELAAVERAYPGAKSWRDKEGLWVITESALLRRLPRSAVFLTGISPQLNCVRGWGFWEDPLALPWWIGPRHTNFPDGSICAFEPTDQTWVMGDSIVELLDLYTVWALRHFYLEVFGRWPGPQAVRWPYERLLEFRADEHCGCGASAKLYGECCLRKDLSRKRIPLAISFLAQTGGGHRRPPVAVVNFSRDRGEPPRLRDVFGAARDGSSTACSAVHGHAIDGCQ
jgi:hypothetical protein